MIQAYINQCAIPYPKFQIQNIGIDCKQKHDGVGGVKSRDQYKISVADGGMSETDFRI